MDMLEQSMVKSQRLLAEAKLATSLVREGPVKAIDWEAEREVTFGEETLAPGSIGMRVEWAVRINWTQWKEATLDDQDGRGWFLKLSMKQML